MEKALERQWRENCALNQGHAFYFSCKKLIQIFIFYPTLPKNQCLHCLNETRKVTFSSWFFYQFHHINTSLPLPCILTENMRVQLHKDSRKYSQGNLIKTAYWEVPESKQDSLIFPSSYTIWFYTIFPKDSPWATR